MRFFKIDWSTYGHTRHWLSGLAFFDYVLRESGAMEDIRRQVYREHPLMRRIRLNETSQETS
jgi:hypothetical protein